MCFHDGDVAIFEVIVEHRFECLAFSEGIAVRLTVAFFVFAGYLGLAAFEWKICEALVVKHFDVGEFPRGIGVDDVAADAADLAIPIPPSPAPIAIVFRYPILLWINKVGDRQIEPVALQLSTENQ